MNVGTYPPIGGSPGAGVGKSGGSGGGVGGGGVGKGGGVGGRCGGIGVISGLSFGFG